MKFLSDLLFVGLGGMIGSIMRYLVSGWTHKILSSLLFPYGTLTVNVTGCLLIGILGGLSENKEFLSPQMRLFLFIGVLGGFTTFSTFGYETAALLRDREFLQGFLNIGLNLIVCLFAVFSGYAISNMR